MPGNINQNYYDYFKAFMKHQLDAKYQYHNLTKSKYIGNLSFWQTLGISRLALKSCPFPIDRPGENETTHEPAAWQTFFFAHISSHKQLLFVHFS